MDSNCLTVHPVNKSYPPNSRFVGQINANSAFICSTLREKKVKQEQRVKTINSFRF